MSIGLYDFEWLNAHTHNTETIKRSFSVCPNSIRNKQKERKKLYQTHANGNDDDELKLIRLVFIS